MNPTVAIQSTQRYEPVQTGILLKIASVFPFHFFPDTLTIENDAITIVQQRFLGAKWIHRIAMTKVSNVSVATTLFFATLEITESPYMGSSNTIQVRHLKPADAYGAQLLIQKLQNIEMRSSGAIQHSNSPILQPIAFPAQSYSEPPTEFGNTEKTVPKNPHYYGDIVRLMYFLISIIMVISVPAFQSLIPIPLFAAVAIILALGIVAGLTNPVQHWVLFLNVVIALVGFLIFEYYAVIYFQTTNLLFFLANQALAVIFFFALYYSTKTVRGFLVQDKRLQQ